MQAVLWLLHGAGLLSAPAPRTPPMQDTPVVVPCTAPQRRALPAPGHPASLSVAGDGLLTLTEQGQEIHVEAQDVVEIATPLRLGKFSVLVHAGENVRLGRAWPGAAPGQVEIVLDCAPDDRKLRERAWQTRVQAFEKQIAELLPAKAYDDLLPQLDALRSSATPGYEVALSEHLRAHALAMTGRSADAAAAFASARQRWLAIGDRERALEALMAEAEDLLHIGAYADVLARTRSLPAGPARGQYFGVRLENSRCLALQYLTRLDEASKCFARTIPALADLGETLERISTLQDYAQLELDRGQVRHAESLAADALAAISDSQWDAIEGPDIPIVRGRVERLMSDLALRRGDVAGSLRHSQSALAHFNAAHHLRWQGNMLLRIAATYRDIGAYADATDAVNAALQRFSPRDAPARVAMAEFAKARIEVDARDPAQAIESAAKARSMFESLKMPKDAAAAGLTLAEATLATARPGEARAALDSIETVPGLTARRELISAEIAVGTAGAGADINVDQLQRSARPLSEWLRVQVVVARQLFAKGRRDAALRVLEQAALHVADLAAQAGNPILRMALQRRQQSLLSAALPMILAGESMQEKTARVWRWAVLAEVAPPRDDAGKPAARTEEFDRALASSLLPAAPSGDKPKPDDVLQQRLLELVASAATVPVGGARRGLFDTPLQQVQAALPRGTVLLAIVAGSSSPALLYVSAEKAAVAAMPGGVSAGSGHASSLAASIAADEPLAEIEAGAGTLSQALLGALDGTPLPQRLLIVAAEPFNGLPWPLLRWPGSSAPLVETTDISLVAPGASAARKRSDAISLQVFASRPDGDGGNSLPELAAAGGELAAIAEQRRQRGWRVAAPGQPSRAAVLAALGGSGDWVHIAGHGSSRAEYLGRSGLWLGGAAPGAAPEMLSWMDVVEHGIRADVVVLNACALGSSTATSLSASTGFAEAVLSAGARDVVAALWPIDDTAASLWATTFYAQLPERPATGDIAAALRAAMQRLRDSRTFRHPKYWASLVHLARFDPTAAGLENPQH